MIFAIGSGKGGREARPVIQPDFRLGVDPRDEDEGTPGTGKKGPLEGKDLTKLEDAKLRG